MRCLRVAATGFVLEKRNWTFRPQPDPKCPADGRTKSGPRPRKNIGPRPAQEGIYERAVLKATADREAAKHSARVMALAGSGALTGARF